MGEALEGFGALFNLYGLFRRTRRALYAWLLQTEELGPEMTAFLATETLSHVEAAQEGFRQTVRASDGSVQEWRSVIRPADLINCILSPDTRLEQRLGAAQTGVLLAANHALLLFSLLPTIPPEAVSFPGLPTYQDIPKPHGPHETTRRLEEIEATVWEVATGRLHRRGALPEIRRAYAFFEAGSWLGGGMLRQVS